MRFLPPSKLSTILWSLTISQLLLAAPPPEPAPGELLSVGNHKLHIRCLGPTNSGITVLFESGGGGFSKDWTEIQNLLSNRVRTCAYDRAGSGWSESGPAPRTMRQETYELHNLLEAAKITGPIVLVGQSIGGPLVRIYTEHYGSNVVGLVLVDPTHEDTVLFSTRENRWFRVREKATGRTIPEPRREGPSSTGYKPEEDYFSEELQLLYLVRKTNPYPLGDRPLIVLGAGKRPPPPGMTEDTWKDLRKQKDAQVEDLAKLSRNAKFIRDPEGTHHLHKDSPQLVVRAIEEVIAAAATGKKLTP